MIFGIPHFAAIGGALRCVGVRPHRIVVRREGVSHSSSSSSSVRCGSCGSCGSGGGGRGGGGGNAGELGDGGKQVNQLGKLLCDLARCGIRPSRGGGRRRGDGGGRCPYNERHTSPKLEVCEWTGAV